jgi:hypothetical protein
MVWDSDHHDVVIYGGTSAAVTAAVQAGRMGATAVVVSPPERLGGMTTGGLGWTDLGDKATVGGVCREFYRRVWDHYQSPDAWTWQRRSDFEARTDRERDLLRERELGSRWDPEARMASVFEPSVAASAFEAMLDEAGVPVHRDRWLDRADGVDTEGDRITSVTTLDGTTYHGDVFLDATYEGDLLAAAGVEYRVGRESADAYDEEWAGVRTGAFHHDHNFQLLDEPVDPYVEPGTPDSGLVPRVREDDPGPDGTGDGKVQAYCYRLCLTDAEENRVPFPRPEGYDPAQYELLLRVYDAGWPHEEQFRKFDPVPNRKTDTNNHGPFSTDNVGESWEYPEASYERRAAVAAAHERYQKGLFYFLANDPRVPDPVRQEMSRWGLAADEFPATGGWPHQLYVREGRRMVGEYVMTEHDVLGRRTTPRPVGMGAYTMDSHHVQRYVREDGAVANEGDIGVGVPRPYGVAYGSLTPRSDDCVNLLAPVAVSASHVAFGSIRMEPVFMILGQSAATAAALAADRGVSVQNVPYDALRRRLRADGQVLRPE